MGKALRGLVIVILLLSIAALVFASLNFNKRELLKARNQTMEDYIVKIAKTIEATDPEDADALDLQKDISEVTDRELANPEKESVFENYPAKLEKANIPTMDLDGDDARLQLRALYKLDPEGKYELGIDGKPSRKGKGTMAESLDKVFDRAKTQQAALNKTRDELSKMRQRVEAEVGEINKLKADGRTTKKNLTETREQVAQLTTEKEALEGRVAKLTAEKKELSAELADTKNEVEKLNEEKTALNDELASKQQTIDELKKRLRGDQDRPQIANDNAVAVTSLSAGDKGKIIAANDELKFVIIEFSPEAIEEMLGADRQNALPQLTMNIRRKGRQSASGDFVTRIKLRQVVRGKNVVVADILNDWQQSPVEKGDVVFF